MNNWVLASERHYLNGTNAVLYFVKYCTIFNEVCGSPEKAKHFRTRKEAEQFRREYGLFKFKAVRGA